MRRPPHIFVRAGNVLTQCTEEAGELNTSSDDQRIAPTRRSKTTPERLDRNKERLEQIGIPLTGPILHRGVEYVSIHFRSPEGHKLEITTWEPYPGNEAGMLGLPQVGLIDWTTLTHTWPTRGTAGPAPEVFEVTP